MTSAMIIPCAARIALLSILVVSVKPEPEAEPEPESESEPESDPDPEPDPDPPPSLLPPPASGVVEKGSLSELMVARVKSTLNCEWPSCWTIFAALSVEAIEGPCFHAAIQPAPVLLSAISPPAHVWQLEHTTLAVMVVPSVLTPLPARSVKRAAVLSLGIVYPWPKRGDRVTLPVPSWYIRKILEPGMPWPVPSATHWNDVGALIWK